MLRQIERVGLHALNGVLCGLVLTLVLTGTAQAQGKAPPSIHQCARQLDRACVIKALDSGIAVDVPDAEGHTALRLAVDALMLGRDASKTGLALVTDLFERGASDELSGVQAYFNFLPDHPATPLLREALSNKRSVEAWRKARDDARVREELELTTDEFAMARESLAALRQSGRFVDLYVAYGVSRNIDDIKRAQSMASSKDEYRVLEHMAVLTVADPAELVTSSVTVEQDALRQLPGRGAGYSSLADLSRSNDLALLIRLRQTPDSKLKLRFGSYEATVDVVVGVFKRSGDAIDPTRVMPVVIPVKIRLVPTNYVGAGVMRLSDFKDVLERSASILGTDLAISRQVQTRLIRLQRLE